MSSHDQIKKKWGAPVSITPDEQDEKLSITNSIKILYLSLVNATVGVANSYLIFYLITHVLFAGHDWAELVAHCKRCSAHPSKHNYMSAFYFHCWYCLVKESADPAAATGHSTAKKCVGMSVISQKMEKLEVTTQTIWPPDQLID